MQYLNPHAEAHRHAPLPIQARRAARWLLAAAVLAFTGFFATSAAFALDSAITYQGLQIPTTAKVAGTELQLNGVGYRGWTIYKAYVAALYLPRKTSSAAEALGQEGPKRVQLRLLVSGSSSYFADALTGGIQKRVPADQFAAMKPRVEAFDRLIRDAGDLKKGDVIDLDFLPETGLVVLLNGKKAGNPVPGADLYTAMLKIWLGDDARDKELRAAMLGGIPG
jgi:hypothetical protein